MKNQNIFLISSHCLDMAAPAVEGAAVAALRSVMARVRYAAERSGREPELIRVVAVSKTKPVSLIRQVYDAGHRCFGENYVHEILDKAPQLPEDVEWHFVGHLQSNKVKSLLSGVPNLSMVEGVHNEKIVNHLDNVKRAQRFLYEGCENEGVRYS